MKLYHCLLLGRILIGLLTLLGALGLAQVSFAQSASPVEILHIDQILVDPTTGQRTQIILSDGGVGNTSLQDLVIVLLTSDDNTILAAYSLEGGTTDSDGFFTLGAAEATSDLAIDLSVLQSADAVAFYVGDVAAFTSGSRASTANVIDLVLFALADNNELLAQRPLLPANTAPIAPVAAAAPMTTTAATDCGASATLIHTIQGATDASPRLGDTVTIEGIVVGDFQNVKTQLRGFFVQEEAADQDDDPATSEGIFVLDNGFKVDVAAGDRVRVRGLVHEFNTMTELKRIESVLVCDQGNPLEPTSVTLPEPENGDLERYEGMFTRIANEMTVAQTYFLGRYGQMTLAAPGTTGARTYLPTNRFPPDSLEANALAAENARRLLVLDDGRDLSALGDNPNPVPYLGAPPPTVIRAGDTVSNLVGVLDYGRINSAPGNEAALDYRLQPVEAPIFTTTNARTTTPPAVAGALRVASFNVLNYFNGNGQGGGFPTARGAKTSAEFERQRAKIIAALAALDADIIGLMEVENDGYGANSAIQDLVNGLNETQPTNFAYAFIDPRLPRLGGDEITVGLLYRTNTITPTGPALTLDTGAFDQALADEGRSRQPLVQTFVDQAGERFTVAVNHFKSKRPAETMTGGDVDSGNGVGAWNARRTQAAQELVDWLATDPTNSGDPDVLIIGDLNSYAKETPITTIEAAGYVNLIAHFVGDEAYSYVFDGQAGYLDHALASTTLVNQTIGAADWHINTDEPKVLDYEMRFNPPGYFSPTPFRASDHDPVLIGLKLGTAAITDTTGVTDTTGITDTTGMTDTTGITDTVGVTDTTGITETMGITDTTGITDSTGITDTTSVTDTTGITDTFHITDTKGMTETAGVTDTLTPTAPNPITDTTTISTPPAPTTPEQAAPLTYDVQTGDTLSTLARRYSVTIAALAEANQMPIHGELCIGRQLSIPPLQATVPCWRIIVGQTGETVATIAARYNADADRLAQLNGLNDAASPVDNRSLCIPNIYAGYIAPPPDYLVYIVQPGDTLQAIANRYGVAVAWIQKRNGLLNANYLDIGQRLLIPR